MRVRVALLCLTVACLATAACSGGSKTHATSKDGADLAAVRAATRGTGIFFPFRPPRLGRRSCTIILGGPPTATVQSIRAICETRVLHRGRSRLVVLSESWNARDFAGSGAGARRRLKTSWLVTVTPAGVVRHVAIRGDFPPQLVR